MQTDNQRLVGGYNLYKMAKKISTNDPNAFTQPDEEAQKAVQTISAAATTVQNKASAAVKTIQSKTSPLAKKIQSHAPPVAKKIQNTAAAAVNTIQSVPDEARAAYDEIFKFFDKKVWHASR